MSGLFGLNFLYEKVGKIFGAQVHTPIIGPRPVEPVASCITEQSKPPEITVGCVESVTAGALSNALCSRPGSSRIFMGGIIAYSVPSKKTMLGIDIQYSETHNFANHFTTSEMVKSAAAKIPARIILGTTGFSLPFNSPTMQIDKPYAIVALYDKDLDHEIMHTIDLPFDPSRDRAEQRAENQVSVAFAALELLGDHLEVLGVQY